MSNDSIEPGTSANAYELDDTEPSVATSEQSDRDAALASNEYPYGSASAQAEDELPRDGLSDPHQDYADSVDYPGGLAALGLVDPELEQVLEESDYDSDDRGPENAEQNPTGLGEPSPEASGRTNAEQNPTGLGNPSPTAVGEPNARHNTTGLGNPNPDAVGSTNAEQNTTGLGDPSTQQEGRSK
jgi:hypothetical protein